jgi:hypothetical protein
MNESVKHWYYQNFTSASVSITLVDGKSPVSGINITMDSQITSDTKSDGKTIFENVSKRRHIFRWMYHGKAFSFEIPISDTQSFVDVPPWNFNVPDSVNKKLIRHFVTNHKIKVKVQPVSSRGVKPDTVAAVQPPKKQEIKNPDPPVQPVVHVQPKKDSTTLIVYRTAPQPFYQNFGIRINSMKKNETEANISLGILTTDSLAAFRKENNFDIQPGVQVIKFSDDSIYKFYINASEFDWKFTKSNCRFTIISYKLK